MSPSESLWPSPRTTEAQEPRGLNRAACIPSSDFISKELMPPAKGLLPIKILNTKEFKQASSSRTRLSNTGMVAPGPAGITWLLFCQVASGRARRAGWLQARTCRRTTSTSSKGESRKGAGPGHAQTAGPPLGGSSSSIHLQPLGLRERPPPVARALHRNNPQRKMDTGMLPKGRGHFNLLTQTASGHSGP